jgi:two-component system KDP operon response regulator KdpE
LVEDDRELPATLREVLSVEGYRGIVSSSIADARAVIANMVDNGGLDTVLLDLGLPDGDAGVLVAELRRTSTTPVVVLSARPGKDLKVQLLDAGADDYLAKPFSPAELLARIRVVLRYRGTGVQPARWRYESGGLLVELESRRVEKDGAAVHLTPTGYNLLARLVRAAGKVVTHRQLLREVWDAAFVEHTHYLRLYTAQVRAKLEQDPVEPRLLHTEPGVGFRLASPAV